MEEKKKKKFNVGNFILILIFLVGLGLILYPTVSDQWNAIHQSHAIVDYEKALASLKPADYTKLFAAAEDYNRRLKETEFPLTDYDQVEGYTDTLSVEGSSILGYLIIDKIKVNMPIYHGTSPEVLNVAAGHLEGTTLPIGGKGTHGVISAHRGLPSARLFTDLDRLEEGDRFVINVLDRTLTYQVDQILIVEPYELHALDIVEGEDYITLLTCTPYGINTHRLLVRGHRVENEEEERIVNVVSDAFQVDPILVAPFIGVPLLLVIFIVLSIHDRKVRQSHRKDW